MPTRFCSEYGVESFPARETLESFIQSPQDMRLLSPVMLTHQKCRSGNVKMRYYILSKFREPRDFSDFCVLSQIMQAEAMRHAADFWRCNMGRCNGSLYWQYNDCWPTASWAGMDYYGRPKALQYRARHFNAPQSAIALLGKRPWKSKAPLFVINETPLTALYTVRWQVLSLGGGVLLENENAIAVPAAASTPVCDLFEQIRLAAGGNTPNPRDCAIRLELTDASGQTLHTQYYLPVSEKKARLLSPEIRVTDISESGGRAYFTLAAKRYARFVWLSFKSSGASDDVAGTEFTDNFFDIPGGESITVSARLPQGKSAEALAQRLVIRSAADIPYIGNPLRDNLVRMKILLDPKTHLFKPYPQREREV
jgi:beta-mannosidase